MFDLVVVQIELHKPAQMGKYFRIQSRDEILPET
jgi:hypothetical protein